MSGPFPDAQPDAYFELARLYTEAVGLDEATNRGDHFSDLARQSNSLTWRSFYARCAFTIYDAVDWVKNARELQAAHKEIAEAA